MRLALVFAVSLSIKSNIFPDKYDAPPYNPLLTNDSATSFPLSLKQLYFSVAGPIYFCRFEKNF